MFNFDKKASILVHRPEVHCRLLIERPLFHPAMPALNSLIVICLLLLSAIVLLPQYSTATTVEVEIIQSQDKYPAGGKYPILFNLHISGSWYIHGSKESDPGLVHTEISFPETRGIKVTDIKFPATAKKKFAYSDEAVDLFFGDIPIRATLHINKSTPPQKIKIIGKLSYQACTSQYCLPPEDVTVPLRLTIVPAGAQAKILNHKTFAKDNKKSFLSMIPEGSGIWLTLLMVFLGGMALNLTPCIYPLIPITVSYFGGKSKEIQGRTLVHGGLYISGLAISNSILGLTASLTGSMMGRLLQEPVVLILIAGILAFLAMSFFDLWEFQLPSSLNRLASKSFGGYFGTFFMGLTLGIVAAPCLGPFMLGLLTYVAQKGNPFLGFLLFFVLSIGMGLPLALLAIFSGTLKKLPMSGGWLLWIRKALGWVLLGMASYMIMPLISSPSGKTTLIAVIFVSAGLHLGWLDKSTAAMRFFPLIKKGLGAVLICVALFLFLDASSEENEKGVQWSQYTLSILNKADEDNKPVILDFYAEWCSPCKALDKKVFMDSEVVALSRQFVTVRVDLTTKHPYQQELQEKFKIKGVPTIIFINRDGLVENETIESFVDRDIVLEKMKRLIEK